MFFHRLWHFGTLLLLKPWRCWPDVCAPAVAVVTLHQCGPPLWHSGCKGCEGDMDIATCKAAEGNSCLPLCFQHLSLSGIGFLFIQLAREKMPFEQERIVFLVTCLAPIFRGFSSSLDARHITAQGIWYTPFGSLWWEPPLKPSVSVFCWPVVLRVESA